MFDVYVCTHGYVLSVYVCACLAAWLSFVYDRVCLCVGLCVWLCVCFIAGLKRKPTAAVVPALQQPVPAQHVCAGDPADRRHSHGLRLGQTVPR